MTPIHSHELIKLTISDSQSNFKHLEISVKDALTMAILHTLKHLLHALTASGGRETGLCEGVGGKEGEGRGRGGRERERRGGRVTGTGKRGAEGGKGEGGKGEGGKGEGGKGEGGKGEGGKGED